MNASKSSHLLKAVESVNLKASEHKGDNMTVEHEGVKKDAWAAVRQ
jgi:hypothetical protein